MTHLITLVGIFWGLCAVAAAVSFWRGTRDDTMALADAVGVTPEAMAAAFTLEAARELDDANLEAALDAWGAEPW